MQGLRRDVHAGTEGGRVVRPDTAYGIEIGAVGRVRRPEKDLAVLEVDPTLADALDGIRPGDSVQVLYWMHELTAVSGRWPAFRPECAPGRAAARQPARMASTEP